MWMWNCGIVELLSIRCERIPLAWKPEWMNEGARFLPLHVSCWHCESDTVLVTCALQHESHPAVLLCQPASFILLLPPQSELKLPPVLFQSNTFDWIATLACCSSASLLTAQQIGVPATFQHEPDLVWRFSWNANPLLCNLMICCTHPTPFHSG